ncbi:hypothetical protein NC653_028460 [Populus alba x Populus x berolinensis]|uniref:Uncharacterized protein n=1 Tax=Populus alba x Populus x berolinensis TaxID=444605 RepID=A0AAD6M088_9ROSI|nr:hypothetical protein NC653_028460 [Populus alba x Populus x berolinensis]
MHNILNREVTEKCDTNLQGASSLDQATHHASGGNVITLSDDSTRSNTTGNGKPNTIPVAKHNHMNVKRKACQLMLFMVFHRVRDQRKSCLKIVSIYTVCLVLTIVYLCFVSIMWFSY